VCLRYVAGGDGVHTAHVPASAAAVAGQDRRRRSVYILHGRVGLGRLAPRGELSAGISHSIRVLLQQTSPGYTADLSPLDHVDVASITSQRQCYFRCTAYFTHHLAETDRTSNIIIGWAKKTAHYTLVHIFAKY